MAARGLALPKLGYLSASSLFLLIAAVALLLADLKVIALDPWAELRRLVAGLLRPDLLSIEVLSVVWTVAFAVLGVGDRRQRRLPARAGVRAPTRGAAACARSCARCTSCSGRCC